MFLRRQTQPKMNIVFMCIDFACDVRAKITECRDTHIHIHIHTQLWYNQVLSHCVTYSRGGRRHRTLYADSPPPPWKLAGKCRTMGAEGALRKFCLT